MILVRRLAFAATMLAVAAPVARAADKADKQKEPEKVSYYRDVRPIFQQHCQGCHQPAKAQGGYVMISYAELLKKGDHERSGIVPGRPEESMVLEQITPQNGKPPVMPRGKDPLTDHQTRLIKRWITDGAVDDTPASAKIVIDAEHPPTYELPPVITALAYSPDSKLLAVGGYHEVLLHKADGSGLIARLIGLSERVQSLAFSPDGKWLAVTGGAPGRFGEVQVWDVAKKKLKMSIPVTYDTVYGVSWSHDGTKIAFGGADNSLRAIDAETGKQILYQGGHSDWVLDTVFSKDASHLISVSRDRSMKLTEVATERLVDNITSITPGALKGGLIAVDRHPTKDDLLIGGADGTPKLYQMYRTKPRQIGDDYNFIRSYAPLPGRIFSAHFNADGSRLIVGSSNERQGTVRVYRTEDPKNDPKSPAAQAVALTTPMTPAARVALMARVLALVPPIPPPAMVTLEGQKGPVYAVAYRRDGKEVASAGFDGVVRLSDPDTGRLIREFIPCPLKGGTQTAGAK